MELALPPTDALAEFARLHPATAAVHADLDLGVVVVEVAGKLELWLTPGAAADLAMALLGAAMRLRRHEMEEEGK